MDPQNIPIANRILAFAKVQRAERVLVLGQNALNIAAVVKTIDESRLVEAEDLRTQNTREPADPSIWGPELPQEPLILDAIIEKLPERHFQLLICTGRPDLTSIPTLQYTLRLLSTLGAQGSRVFIEMYRSPSDGGQFEHWSRTESVYRQAARSAGFRLEEVNGVARDEDLPTTVADIHALTVSLLDTACSIKKGDNSGAEVIRRVARTQRCFLKGACNKDINRAASKSLKILLGGRGRRLFATLSMEK